jgi:Ca2+-binding EF-hand superfamily protein
MLQALITNEFEPATAERLLDAFKVLDPQGLGYVRTDVMHQLLTTKGIPFRVKEYEDFKKFAVGRDPDKIYYEDYVARLIEENERHLEYLLKDYHTFKPSMGN